MTYAIMQFLRTCFIEYDLKNDIYDHYQKLDSSFLKNNSTGDLMNRISEDVSKVRMYLGPSLMYTINTAFAAIITLVFMFSVDLKLSLLTLAPNLGPLPRPIRGAKASSPF